MAPFSARSGGRTPAPGVALLLAVLALVPTVAMLVLAGQTTKERWYERQAAQEVQHEASMVRSHIALQSAVTQESINNSYVTGAADLGLDRSTVLQILGFDPTTEMVAARAVVDALPLPTGDPALMRDLDALGRLRRAIDAGQSSMARVMAFQQDFRRHTTTVLNEELARMGDHAAASGGGATGSEGSVEATRLLLLAFREASDRLDSAVLVLMGAGGSAERRSLIEADARFRLAMAGAGPLLGEQAGAAAGRLTAAAATERFDAAVTQARAAGGSDAGFDPRVQGSALVEGAIWLAGVSAVLDASTEDVWLITSDLERDATATLTRMAIAVALILVLAAATTLAGARSIVLAANGLAQAARRIAGGDFHEALHPGPLTGPRELREIGGAMVDLTHTLAALEVYVTDLADDPISTALDRPLPGATGRALQMTVDRLRAGLKRDEETRAQLAEFATHDALTGLLNRGAAVAAIEHELHEDRRSSQGGLTALLFIDLDGLKDINDRHGHAAGDAAIRLTAEALQWATRRADIVARIGGDEFVVAVRAVEKATVDALAARISGALADRPLTLDGAAVALRCSIGIALAEPGEGADDLLQRADAALYRAKGAGRNQVAWHEPDGPDGPEDPGRARSTAVLARADLRP